MQIVKAAVQNRDLIISLLKTTGLPVDDLPDDLFDFYITLNGNELVGVIGMERYHNFGLLRSMVVHPNHRNKGIADALIMKLEQEAKATGITEMYLLTETADKYFTRKGYNPVTRETVPAQIQRSSEFSHVCPVSAVVMKKNLERSPELINLA